MTGSEAQAEVQTEADGRGVAVVVERWATQEVAAVGAVECCWRSAESDSAQRAVQQTGDRHRRRSAIREPVGKGEG